MMSKIPVVNEEIKKSFKFLTKSVLISRLAIGTRILIGNEVFKVMYNSGLRGPDGKIYIAGRNRWGIPDMYVNWIIGETNE